MSLRVCHVCHVYLFIRVVLCVVVSLRNSSHLFVSRFRFFSFFVVFFWLALSCFALLYLLCPSLLVCSCLDLFCCFISCLVLSRQHLSCLFFCFILNSSLPCLALPRLVLFCHDLCCLLWSCLVLFCFAFSCIALTYLMLSCLV